MSNNSSEIKRTSVGRNPNRRGIDEDNLQDLRALAVEMLLGERSDQEPLAKVINAFSPDVALQMLRDRHKWHARVLEDVEEAETALKALAHTVDADGRMTEQIEAFPLDRYDYTWYLAEKALRRSFAKGKWQRPDAETTGAINWIREQIMPREVAPPKPTKSESGAGGTDSTDGLPF